MDELELGQAIEVPSPEGQNPVQKASCSSHAQQHWACVAVPPLLRSAAAWRRAWQRAALFVLAPGQKARPAEQAQIRPAQGLAASVSHLHNVHQHGTRDRHRRVVQGDQQVSHVPAWLGHPEGRKTDPSRESTSCARVSERGNKKSNDSKQNNKKTQKSTRIRYLYEYSRQKSES